MAANPRSVSQAVPTVKLFLDGKLVESMASGVPAVGVDDGGVREVVSNPRWLARPDDVHSLSEAINRALDDARDPATVVACQNRAAQFDWTVRGPAFARLYADVIDERRRARVHRRPPRPYSR